MKNRGFTLTVLLILAAAMFASNLVTDNSNDLSGMQIREPEEKPNCFCEGSHIIYSDIVGLPMGYCRLISEECDSETLACSAQLGCDYKCRMLPDMNTFEIMDFCEGTNK